MYQSSFSEIEKSHVNRHADPRALFVTSMDVTQPQATIFRALINKLSKRRIGR